MVWDHVGRRRRSAPSLDVPVLRLLCQMKHGRPAHDILGQTEVSRHGSKSSVSCGCVSMHANQSAGRPFVSASSQPLHVWTCCASMRVSWARHSGRKLDRGSRLVGGCSSVRLSVRGWLAAARLCVCLFEVVGGCSCVCLFEVGWRSSVRLSLCVSLGVSGRFPLLTFFHVILIVGGVSVYEPASIVV